MLRRAAVVVGACVLLACSGDDGPSTVVSSSGTPASVTSTTSTTTVTVPLAPASSPQQAASQFVDAWRGGNSLLASTVAVPDAVNAVFAAGEPGRLEARGCNSPPPDSPVLCAYRTGVGELQLRIRPEGDGWIVEQAILSAS